MDLISSPDSSKPLDILEESAAYFDRIGLSESARKRVAAVVQAFQFICPQPLEELFIADAVDDAGQRQWLSVWAFTAKYWLEAKGFLQEFDVDVSGYQQSVKYLGIQFEDVAFNAPDALPAVSASSRLYVEVRTGEDLDTNLPATGVNCEFLFRIIRDRLKPNLRPEIV